MHKFSYINTILDENRESSTRLLFFILKYHVLFCFVLWYNQIK
nr:MAG TPA: hypothetical protein [Caudoviricetes sp.]